MIFTDKFSANVANMIFEKEKNVEGWIGGKNVANSVYLHEICSFQVLQIVRITTVSIKWLSMQK